MTALRLMADGKSNKQIAGELGISDRAVKTHLGHLFEKLGVTSRSEAEGGQPPRSHAVGLRYSIVKRPRVATAVGLAPTHMIVARRSVGALRPDPADGENVAAALHRMTDLTRRTTNVPIDLTIGAPLPAGLWREAEIVGIAQEALTNVSKHVRNAC